MQWLLIKLTFFNLLQQTLLNVSESGLLTVSPAENRVEREGKQSVSHVPMLKVIFKGLVK